MANFLVRNPQKRENVINDIQIQSGSPSDGEIIVYDSVSNEWVFSTGSAGPTGPTGPTGSAGPAGPAGPYLQCNECN